MSSDSTWLWNWRCSAKTLSLTLSPKGSVSQISNVEDFSAFAAWSCVCFYLIKAAVALKFIISSFLWWCVYLTIMGCGTCFVFSCVFVSAVSPFQLHVYEAFRVSINLKCKEMKSANANSSFIREVPLHSVRTLILKCLYSWLYFLSFFRVFVLTSGATVEQSAVLLRLSPHRTSFCL